MYTVLLEIPMKKMNGKTLPEPRLLKTQAATVALYCRLTLKITNSSDRKDTVEVDKLKTWAGSE